MSRTTRKTTNKPAAKKGKGTASRKPVTLSQLTVIIAERKGMTTTDAGKRVRSYLRRHDIKTLESAGYSGLSKVKSAANDGNRWPAMPAKFARDVIAKLG